MIAVNASGSMTGTTNQIEWAEQIKKQVNAEFDRVAKALQSVTGKDASAERTDVQLLIKILEDKRAQVMENHRAGYFIHDWQELRTQVRDFIKDDSRYQRIKESRTRA